MSQTPQALDLKCLNENSNPDDLGTQWKRYCPDSPGLTDGQHAFVSRLAGCARGWVGQDITVGDQSADYFRKLLQLVDAFFKKTQITIVANKKCFREFFKYFLALEKNLSHKEEYVKYFENPLNFDAVNLQQKSFKGRYQDLGWLFNVLSFIPLAGVLLSVYQPSLTFLCGAVSLVALISKGVLSKYFVFKFATCVNDAACSRQFRLWNVRRSFSVYLNTADLSPGVSLKERKVTR